MILSDGIINLIMKELFKGEKSITGERETKVRSFLKNLDLYIQPDSHQNKLVDFNELMDNSKPGWGED